MYDSSTGVREFLTTRKGPTKTSEYHTHSITHQNTIPLQLIIRQQLSSLSQLSLSKERITFLRVLQNFFIVTVIDQLLQRGHYARW